MSLEDIEKKRAAMKEAREMQRQQQLEKDLLALLELEEEHGDLLVRIDCGRYVPGLPTLCVFKMPDADAVKRYQDRIKGRNGKPGDGIAASIELATYCQKGMYPDDATYKKVCDVFGNLPVNAGKELIEASQGVAAEEGKE